MFYKNDKLIGSIKRNYSSFPFLFFVQHDKEYLISGRSYMRQTILDCETGQTYDNSEDPEASNFCWSNIMQLDKNTIVVYGCDWGASYEYKFFDFNLPYWTELKMDEEIIYKGYTNLDYTEHSTDNGILSIKQTDYGYDDDLNDDEVINMIVKLKREDDVIKLVDVWMSESQKIIEEEKEVKRVIENKRTQLLKDNNLFYQEFMKRICDFKVNDHIMGEKFVAYVSRKKDKTCIIEFTQESKINFKYYHWNNNDKLILEFDQDINVINKIINKIKELLD